MGKLVSVVIPTYNCGRYVAEAVQSALAQSYRPIEVIVVDDGSTDDTRAALRPFSDSIQYLRQANAGVSAARNTGIRAARGEYVALLDADDVWAPTKIAKQVALLDQATSRTGVVFCEFDRVSVHTGASRRRRYSPELRGDLHRRLLQRCWFMPSAALIRRACFDQVGLFDPAFNGAEDWEMWIRISRHFHFDYIPEPLLSYRIHGANASGNIALMHARQLQVIEHAFRAEPMSLYNRLRRRSIISFLQADVGKDYYWTGEYEIAVRHLLRAIVLWPLEYARYTFLARALIRQAQLRTAASRPAADHL